MKSRLLILIGLFFQSPLMGQVLMSEFLKSSTWAPQVKSVGDQLTFLQDKPYRLSPLQKLEFRTQNRELNPAYQEYGIRFTPANPWEMRNNNHYFQHYQNALSLEKNIVLKQVLQERYQLIISYVYYVDLKSFAEATKKLLGDQLSVIEKQASSSLFDADEYVKLKVEWLNKSVSVEEIDFDLVNQRSQINLAYPDAFQKEIDWNSSNLISVDRIKQVVDSLHTISIASSQVTYQQQKVELAESEYKLEKANVNVGFLQTEYDQRRVEQNRTPINISLGITIPITNPNKGDMTKSKLDQIEAENELKSVQQEAQVTKQMGKSQLESLIIRHHDLQQKVIELEASGLASNLSQLKNGDPLVIIQFEESLNKLKVLQAKIRRNILLSYVEYLSVNDHVQQQPFINFLTNKLEVIR